MLLPIFTIEECKYCKKKVIRHGCFAGEWVCPACGKTNRKKLLSGEANDSVEYDSYCLWDLDGNGLYVIYGQMGCEIITRIMMTDRKIVKEVVNERVGAR